MTGTFLVVEGPDGAGKTTLVAALVQRLSDAGHRVVQVREPGGTPSAELLRSLVLDQAEHTWTDAAELFIILAARAELVHDVIRPAVEDGAVVVSDRFDLSTIAYQAIGRGLPRSEVEASLQLATGGVAPGITLVLDVEVGLGRERQAAAGKAPDRIERAAHELHDRVSAFYADVQGPGIRHIDASDDAVAVADRAWSIVSEYLAEQHSQAQG